MNAKSHRHYISVWSFFFFLVTLFVGFLRVALFEGTAWSFKNNYGLVLM